MADGDTITVRPSEGPDIKVRLAQIDAPEHDQPWGEPSKRALTKLVLGKTVRVRKEDMDRYGRTVAEVFVDGRNINRAMVETGSAWAFRRYLTDQAFVKIEDRARSSHRGLWSLPPDQVTPPWEWRQAGREQGSSAAQLPVAPLLSSAGGGAAAQLVATSRTCGSKRLCSQMSSCEEARFYLQQCGRRSLDRDGDGTPCNSLCR